jgi:2-keto-4-pentenoate hydratase
MTDLTTTEELGHLLGDAYAQQAVQVSVPARLAPADSTAAYQAQQAFLRRRQLGIGGWKIGAKSADGPIQGAPLPRQGIHTSGAALARSDFPVLGIELEVMFRFGRDFLPGAPAVTEEDVLASIASVGASIEIVSSRLAGWPEAPKLNQLADLQNHGALILGPFIDYRNDFAFDTPQATLQLNGQSIFRGPSANPAGDPRRLLPWLVDHCRRHAIPLPAGTVITAGSYTGMYFPKKPGTVTGRIAGLPAVTFAIT